MAGIVMFEKCQIWITSDQWPQLYTRITILRGRITEISNLQQEARFIKHAVSILPSSVIY